MPGSEQTCLPPGFTDRPMSPGDVKAVTALLNEASMEMIGAADFTEAGLRDDFAIAGFDLDLDARLVLAPEGEIVGYADAYALGETPVHPWVMGRVRPSFRGLGIGTALLDWQVERARAVLARVPADARVSVRTSNPESFVPGKQLLENCGFNAYRYSLHMRIEFPADLAEPAPPPGIELVPYRHPERAADVYRVVDESFKDHSGHVDEPFESGFRTFQSMEIEEEGFDPALWILAVEGERIVGVLVGRKWSHTEPEAGYVNTLGVLRSHRRRGIARALLLASFRDYAERGKQAVDLSVDGSSLTGAVGLYESAGMVVHRRNEILELELRPGREISTT